MKAKVFNCSRFGHRAFWKIRHWGVHGSLKGPWDWSPNLSRSWDWPQGYGYPQFRFQRPHQPYASDERTGSCTQSWSLICSLMSSSLLCWPLTPRCLGHPFHLWSFGLPTDENYVISKTSPLEWGRLMEMTTGTWPNVHHPLTYNNDIGPQLNTAQNLGFHHGLHADST